MPKLKIKATTAGSGKLEFNGLEVDVDFDINLLRDTCRIIIPLEEIEIEGPAQTSMEVSP